MKREASPLKRIRKHCLDCCGDSPSEVKYCPFTDCFIWHFRFGYTPKAAIRRLGKIGRDLLDESCFLPGGKFDSGKYTSEIEA